MKNKGALYYTLIGVMVVLLVLALAAHTMKSTYDPKAADIARLSRFSDAIYSLEAVLGSEAKYAEYPLIWQLGHNVTGRGLNIYLSIPNGREKLRKDLIKGFARNLNDRLASISQDNQPGYYLLYINNIPFTLTEIEEDDVSVEETGEGLVIRFWTHINSTHGDLVFDHDLQVTSNVPARLFDMFDRAKSFHSGYQEDVSWATTLALVMRAYLNAYMPKYEGSFLREGHVAYDPLEPFIEADLPAISNLSLSDSGSVPLATWLCEWRYLGEPSFLPPSADFDPGLEGSRRIIGLMRDNYDISKASDCASLSGPSKTECEGFNDPTVVRAKAAELASRRAYLQSLSSSIGAWKPSTDWSCDSFRDSADDLITMLSSEFDTGRAAAEILASATSYTDNTSLEAEINKNMNELSALNASISGLKAVQASRLPVLRESMCSLPSVMDCGCVDGPESCSGSSCTSCDDPSCNKIRCPVDGLDYSCSPYEAGNKRSETVDCERETCREVCSGESCSTECTTSSFTKTLRIPLCNCGCHPKSKIISDITKELSYIKAEIDERIKIIKKQEEELILRALALEASRKALDLIDGLEARYSGYDVVSDLDFSSVKYYPALNSGRCYIDPDWAARQNGTCGNRDESAGLYAAQVSAAVVCCSLAGACCPTVSYATRWFPAVYQVEGYYTISETIIDDRNRVMPHNLFASEGDLYGYNATPKLFTHIAPEFVIYRNYSVSAKPKTGGRILVYLYLQRVGLQKVLDSFTDASCTGKTC